MSKELEAWKRVRESAENADGDAAVYEIGDCDIVEKELKLLEIFKKFFGTNIRVEYRKDTDEYFLCINRFGMVISKEEYDLLREVLL